MSQLSWLVLLGTWARPYPFEILLRPSGEYAHEWDCWIRGAVFEPRRGGSLRDKNRDPHTEQSSGGMLGELQGQVVRLRAQPCCFLIAFSQVGRRLCCSVLSSVKWGYG